MYNKPYFGAWFPAWNPLIYYWGSWNSLWGIQWKWWEPSCCDRVKLLVGIFQSPLSCPNLLQQGSYKYCGCSVLYRSAPLPGLENFLSVSMLPKFEESVPELVGDCTNWTCWFLKSSYRWWCSSLTAKNMQKEKWDVMACQDKIKLQETECIWRKCEYFFSKMWINIYPFICYKLFAGIKCGWETSKRCVYIKS